MINDDLRDSNVQLYIQNSCIFSSPELKMIRADSFGAV